MDMREANRNRQMFERLAQRYGGAEKLAQKMETGIMTGFKPGNVGDINRVVWPFFFPFSSQGDVNPGQTVLESFSVTQEAGFLWRTTTKAAFKKVAGEYTYLDPANFNDELGNANGLKFVIRDAQSTREYHGRSGQDLDTLGYANFPSINSSTVFLLPNQTMQIQFTNTHATNVYRPFVVFFGYRLRIEDAQKILSTVSL